MKKQKKTAEKFVRATDIDNEDKWMLRVLINDTWSIMFDKLLSISVAK